MSNTIEKIDMFEDVEVAREVLELESKSILNLAKSLDGSFIDLINTLASTQGRVIVTGMGKSGLIARKVCSTLASTGTPSHYVHPAEASHGDLGMITKKDVILALSFSGETKELSDIISHAKRFDIPLLSITGKTKSTLSESSEVSLVVDIDREACPHDLAPTTSTTCMLALGDAIAITLLRKKGFSKFDYKHLHPGGSLGLKLMLVSELMRPRSELPIVSFNDDMQVVLKTISDRNFGCVGVLNSERQLIGMITDGDLRRSIDNTFLSKSPTDIMTQNPITTKTKDLVVSMVSIMSAKQITAMFVVDESNKPIGLLRLHDCLKVGLG